MCVRERERVCVCVRERERESVCVCLLFVFSVGRRGVMHGYFDPCDVQDNNNHYYYEQLSACHFLFLFFCFTVSKCSGLFAYDDVTIL